jgi:hypothetical protein
MTQPVSRDSAFPSPLSPAPLGPPAPPPPLLTPAPLGIDLPQALQERSPQVALRLTPRVVGEVGGAARSDVGARLDAFLESARPTFVTREGSVTVPIGFYMAGSPVGAHAREQLDPVLAKAGITGRDRDLLLLGKGTPALVTRATQGLIEAGHLPPATTKGDTSLTGRVRQLMFTYGLGVDCAAYVLGAVSSVRGAGPAAGFRAEDDGLYALGARGYQRVPAGAPLQPGDIVCLHGATGNATDEHRVVVRDCQPVPQDALPSTVSLPRDLAAAHAGDSWESVQVDGSWGNYGDPQDGGVARATWLHDRTTGTWVSPQRGQVLTGPVPYGHAWYEVFRPRGAQ